MFGEGFRRTASCIVAVGRVLVDIVSSSSQSEPIASVPSSNMLKDIGNIATGVLTLEVLTESLLGSNMVRALWASRGSSEL